MLLVVSILLALFTITVDKIQSEIVEWVTNSGLYENIGNTNACVMEQKLYRA